MEKLKLVLTRGLPASGKSTFSKEWVNVDPKKRVRVSRDDIRNMLGPYWVPTREDLVTKIENDMIENALGNGYSVIVDATNFRGTKRFEDMTKVYKTEFDVIDFTHVPLETCIERDKWRLVGKVGEDVIRKMHDKYLKDE